MVLTDEEQEIAQFYSEGLDIREIAAATGYTVYQIKKVLALEPLMPAGTYIFRHLKDW